MVAGNWQHGGVELPVGGMSVLAPHVVAEVIAQLSALAPKLVMQTPHTSWFVQGVSS
jgi:hypothetical protein